MSDPTLIHNALPHPSIAVDFDGTLALGPVGNLDVCQPNDDVVALTRVLHADGWYVVVYSARPAAHHPDVAAWLARYAVPYQQLALGTKPAADVVIDDRAVGLAPPAALEEYVRRQDVTAGWQMDRYTDASRPATSGYVHDLWDYHENPEWSGDDDDDRHLVVVPLSGGIDSATALGMAACAGLRVRPVYVDTGADYTDLELDACGDLVAAAQVAFPDVQDLEVLALDVTYPVRHGYVDPGRNAVIVWACAEVLRDANAWGSIWFGNTAEWQETPVRGGDKCHSFFVTTQQLLTLEGYDVQLVSPLVGMTKADALRWWQHRDMLDVVLDGRSCYATTRGHCGACRSCWRRYLAMRVVLGAEADRDGWWPHGTSWRPHVEQYLAAMVRSTSRTMSAGRRYEYDPIVAELAKELNA